MREITIRALASLTVIAPVTNGLVLVLGFLASMSLSAKLSLVIPAILRKNNAMKIRTRVRTDGTPRIAMNAPA